MSKKGSLLKINQRRQQILDILNRTKKISIVDLSNTLNVSLVTVRNDLDVLAEEGKLMRISGGAIISDEAFTKTPVIANYEQKLEIAKKAADLIHDGETLFINSGTTTQLVARELATKKNLNIVTNSLSIATELGSLASFRVILLGGAINAQSGFTYGADAQEYLNRFYAHWTILSVDGVSKEGNLSTCHAEEAIIDRIMINRAKQVLIVADSTKIGRDGFSYVERCNEKIKILTND